jgi:hypothetical protein
MQKVRIMTDTSCDDSLLDLARRLRKQRAAAARGCQLEQEQLDRFRKAVEARGDAVRALLWALDSSTPLSATELEPHCRRVTTLLAAALAALRETGLQTKLGRLDEDATLAHYRQRGQDPQLVQVAYRYARQVIETDPDDHERLTRLVRGAVDEPGLREAWQWISILLNGLAGDQRLVWQAAETTAPLSPETPTVSAAKGAQQLLPTGQGEASGTTNRSAQPIRGGDKTLALSQRQYHILEALKRLGATSPNNREPTCEIARKAEGTTAHSATFKQAVADLARRDLVATKTGRGGGVWLTANGLALIEGIIAARLPKW